MGRTEQDLLALTAGTAARRRNTDPAAFMEAYAWWTERAINGAFIYEEQAPYAPLEIAAQIEACAAARRRDAFSHITWCQCAACKLRRRVANQKTAA